MFSGRYTFWRYALFVVAMPIRKHRAQLLPPKLRDLSLYRPDIRNSCSELLQ